MCCFVFYRYFDSYVKILFFILCVITSLSFAAQRTATRSGNWNNASTWGGVVPRDTDNVVIPRGRTVEINSNTNQLTGIRVEGTLRAARNSDFTIRTDYLIAFGGDIDFGTSNSDRVNGKVTIELTGNNQGADVLGLGTKVLGATNGGTINLYGANKRAWTELRGTFDVGSEWIRIDHIGANWQVGDQIVIASSGYNMNEAEVRTITGIRGAVGTILDLNEPLQFKHFGEIQNYQHPDNSSINWSYNARAEVGLLTRNLTVQGDASSEESKFGGHVMGMGGAEMNARNVAFFRMGQQGALGRYPWHWHNLKNGGQDQYFDNNTVYRSYNRAVTIHVTNGVKVRDNVAYDHVGHGFFFEDGNEVDNDVTGNLGLVTRRPTTDIAILPSDVDNQRNMSGPATFWVTNPLNRINNNRAAGSDGSGIWFAAHQNVNSIGYDDTLNPNAIPVPAGNWDNNVVHSSNHGLLVSPTVPFGNQEQKVEPNRNYLHNLAGDEIVKVKNYTLYKNGLGAYLRVQATIRPPSQWENFIIADNIKGDALTWHAEVDKFLWVGASDNFEPVPLSEETNIVTNIGGGTPIAAHIIYDGPVQTKNSLFTGLDQPDMTMLDQWGATVKFPGHTFEDTRVVGPSPVDFRDNQTLTFRGATARDTDGKLFGTAGTTVHADFPLVNTSNSTVAVGGLNNGFTRERYAYIEALNGDGVNNRQFSFIRRDDGEYFEDRARENNGLPMIVAVNGVHTYEMLWSDYSPGRTSFDMFGMDAGEFVIAGLIGVTNSFEAYLSSEENGNQDGPRLNTVNSMQALRNFNGNAVYFSPDNTSNSGLGTLFFKYTAPAGSDFTSSERLRRVNIYPRGASDNTNTFYPDTDGDAISNFEEYVKGQNPNSFDFDFKFNLANRNFGWQAGGTISGTNPNGASYFLRSSGNDPHVTKSDLDFNGNELPAVKVVYNANTSGRLRFSWKRAGDSNFSTARSVDALLGYEGGDMSETFFDLQSHSLWRNNRITEVRLNLIGSENAVTRLFSISATEINSDTDGDGITDLEELQLGSDPNSASDLAYEFDQTGDSQGWSRAGDIRSLTVENNGLLKVESNGANPEINLETNFAGNEIDVLELRYSSTSTNQDPSLTWTTDSGGAFALVPSIILNQVDGFNIAYFDVSSNADWTNRRVVELGVSVPGGNDTTTFIDYIRAVDYEDYLTQDFDGDGIPNIEELSIGRDPNDVGDLGFEFNGTQINEIEGWRASGTTKNFVADRNGNLLVSSEGGDPGIQRDGFSINTEDVVQIEVRYNANRDGRLELFWRDDSQNYTPSRRQIADSSYSVVDGTVIARFDVRGNSNWIGEVNSLRLDTINGDGANTRIDYIRAISIAEFNLADNDGDGVSNGVEVELGRDLDDPSDFGFEFNRGSDDFLGWSLEQNVASALINNNGRFLITANGNNPLIRRDVQFSGDAVEAISIRYASTQPGNIQFQWLNDQQEWTSINPKLTLDDVGGFKISYFDLAGNANWAGNSIEAVRIRAVPISSVTTFIDYVRSLPASQLTLDSDGDGSTDLIESSLARNANNASDLAFEFTESGQLEGWVGEGNTNSIINDNNGNVLVNSTGGSSFLTRAGLRFDANTVSIIAIEFQANVSGQLSLNWRTADSPIYRGKISFAESFYNAGSGMVTTLFRVGDSSAWNGEITTLRLNLLANDNINTNTRINSIRAVTESEISDFDLVDTDRDGISDLDEGTGDADGDGILNFEDTDSDNDNIPDALEMQVNTNPYVPIDESLDSDNDGYTDAYEILSGHSPDDSSNNIDITIDESPEGMRVVEFQGNPDRVYTVERSTNLDGNWQEVDTIESTNQNDLQFMSADDLMPGEQEFYRIKIDYVGQ